MRRLYHPSSILGTQNQHEFEFHEREYEFWNFTRDQEVIKFMNELLETKYLK